MKNLIKVIGLIGLITMFLTSCTKDELPVDQNGDVQISATKGATSVGGVTSIGGPVIAQPDLVITDFTANIPYGASLNCGIPLPQPNYPQQYDFTVTVKNQGPGPVTNFFHTIISKLNGNVILEIEDSPVSYLAPGESVDIIFSGVDVLGGPISQFSIQNIVAATDIHNDISESNEGNNRGSFLYCGE